MFSAMTTFDAGRTMTSAQSQWVVGMTLKGRVLEVHPDGNFTQETDDVIVLRAGVQHSWRVLDGGAPWTTVFFIFDPWPSLFPLLELPEVRPGILKLTLADSPVREQVRSALVKANRLLHSPWPNRLDLARNAMEEALLWCGADMHTKGRRMDPRIRKALEYLACHAAQPVRLKEVARSASLSVARFITLFREYTGMTPMDYVEKQRMARAQELILLGYHSIKEISALVGYADPAYFSKRFKHHFRLPPGSYRRMSQAHD